MSKSVKIGLIVGAVGFVLTTGISLIVGICGPLVAVFAGAAAGFFAVRETTHSKSDGAREGAIAGLVVGVFLIAAQMIAGVGSLLIMQSSGVELPFGQLPTNSSEQIIYWISGMGTGFCIGLGDLVISALAGAGVGYLAAPKPGAPVVEQPVSPGVDEW